MQVGLVVPSESLHALGGASRGWRALLDALSSTPGVEAILIEAPAAESDTASVFEDYARFIDLDVSSLDVVIATKYPAWMVTHPRLRVWMYHPLRGLYDQYPGPEWPSESSVDAAVLDAASKRNSDAIRELAAVSHTRRDEEFFAFPGPLARRVVTNLDHSAMAGAEQVFTISRTVAARPGYFPGHMHPRALLHPQSLLVADGEVVNGRFFTAGRLDPMKRTDLIIEAARASAGLRELRIAGSGPDEERLRAIAEGDPRITFLGVLDDEQLAREYASALAVPFVPRDEDFGLVTLEAWAHSRPVITVTDSGGVAEMVTDDETGLVVDPSSSGLTSAFDRLIDDRGLADTLGELGLARMREVTWSRVVARLLGPVRSRPSKPPSLHAEVHARSGRTSDKRIVVVASEEVGPKRHGGQIRAAELYGGLAGEVRFVSLATVGYRHSRRRLANGAVEIAVPRSIAHARAESELADLVGDAITDVVSDQLHHMTPEYGRVLERELSDADVIVMSQPYLSRTVLDMAPERALIVYDAQNVEADLKQTMTSGGADASRLYNEVVDLESLAVTQADVVVSVSSADASALRHRYESGGKFVVIPNGVSCGGVRFVSFGERLARQARLLDRLGAPLAHTLGIFLGSMHAPNVTGAADLIDEAMGSKPDQGVHVLLAGAHSHALEPAGLPGSVHSLAVLGNVRKQSLLGSCAVALNPVTQGSGSNLKLLEYLAAGCGVVSTPFGSRGFEEIEEVILVGEAGSLLQRSSEVGSNPIESQRRAKYGRELVERHYDWTVLSSQLAGAVGVDING